MLARDDCYYATSRALKGAKVMLILNISLQYLRAGYELQRPYIRRWDIV